MLPSPNPSPTADALTHFEAQALLLEDQRPHPPEEALFQLGAGVMNELVDLLSETALEDFSGPICEALIGAFHSAAQRIEINWWNVDSFQAGVKRSRRRTSARGA